MSLRLCPECGLPQPPGAPENLCPNCLLQLGIAAADQGSKTPELPVEACALPFTRAFGDYELLAELARGGMGVVFRARQISLNRLVAVKLVHGGVFANPTHVKRFKAEAEAAARLEHPNIVPLFEVGEHDGQAFFSMRLVEGGTLRDAMKRKRFAPRASAALMEVIARTVHFAHQRGILHRDLKPTNILLDGENRPHITDFGLAKILDDESSLTLTLAIMGTPAYMAPEQAAGRTKDLTTAADIYSLGVILYELLCGQPPFAGNSTTAVLREVVEADPPPMRKQNREVDADLETICLKCLEKDPARRYASANELADELGRWIAGQPILARPPATTEHFVRWIRRNPLLASVSSALVLALVLGGLVLNRAYRRTKGALYDSLLTQAQAQLTGRQLGQRFDALAALEKAATIKNSLAVRSEAAAALARPDARLLARWPHRVRGRNLRCAFSPDLETYVVGRTSGGCELRATKDRSLLRFFPETPRSKTKTARQLEMVVFSRDGQKFAVQYHDQHLDVWDRNLNEPILSLSPSDKATGIFDFAPDGKLAVYRTMTEGLCAHSLADGNRRILLPPSTDVRFVRFDPAGGRLILVQSNALQVWNFAEAKSIWTIPAETYVDWAAWSPDGRMVAGADQRSRDVLLFDAATGALLTRFGGHTSTPFIFEFHPAGQWVASTARDSTVQVWDHRNGQVVFKALTGSYHALQFAPDGNRIASGAGTDQIGISEFHLPAVFREFQTTSQGEVDASWMDTSEDGRFLVTATFSDCRLWDTESRRELFVVPTEAHKSGLPRVFFGPNDDEIIYSRGGEGTFRYALKKGQGENGKATIIGVGPQQATLVSRTANLVSVGEDKQSWLIRGHKNNPEIWPAGNREEAKILPPDRGYLSISPDARWIATTPRPPTAMEIWDTASRRKIFTSKSHRVWLTSFSPDGKWLVGTGADGHVVWETGTWKQAFHFQHEGGGNATFAQGGRLMALVRGLGEVQLYAMPEARCLIQLQPPQPLLGAVIKLREDGNRLWLLPQGNRVFEWDLAKLRQELAARGLDWQD